MAGLYIHVPFCKAKCTYCDFNSYPHLHELRGPYYKALLIELDQVLTLDPPSVETVYIGGGTPSTMPTDMLPHLMSRLRTHGLKPHEVTLEANPDTLSLEQLCVYRKSGINRISLGVQSLHDAELHLLGRIHDSDTALRSIQLVRSAGFDNLNVDLIFGIPGQSMTTWRQTLERVLRVAPEHIALYALTLEEETPLTKQVKAGALPKPDPDLVADMYEFSEERLKMTGYEHYEVSNWCKPGQESRHNLIYWENREYVGVGAGAWSYRKRTRKGNIKDVAEYISRSLNRQDLTEEREEVSREQEMSDTLILGLRLTRGVSHAGFRRRFGVELIAVYGEELQLLASQGLLEVDEIGIRLTDRGRLLGNEVFERFLVGP